MIVVSESFVEPGVEVIEVGGADRLEPPADLPSGSFSLCARCGTEPRCASCPRPRDPHSYEIDNRVPMLPSSSGGLLNAVKHRLRTIIH